MDIINYTEARKNFSATMDKVCQNHSPVAITRRDGKPVVMLSLEDYNAWQETEYLLRSTRNRERLLSAKAEAETGQVETHELLEE
jgi:antitoxin YefM